MDKHSIPPPRSSNDMSISFTVLDNMAWPPPSTAARADPPPLARTLPSTKEILRAPTPVALSLPSPYLPSLQCLRTTSMTILPTPSTQCFRSRIPRWPASPACCSTQARLSTHTTPSLPTGSSSPPAVAAPLAVRRAASRPSTPAVVGILDRPTVNTSYTTSIVHAAQRLVHVAGQPSRDWLFHLVNLLHTVQQQDEPWVLARVFSPELGPPAPSDPDVSRPPSY